MSFAKAVTKQLLASQKFLARLRSLPSLADIAQKQAPGPVENNREKFCSEFRLGWEHVCSSWMKKFSRKRSFLYCVLGSDPVNHVRGFFCARQHRVPEYPGHEYPQILMNTSCAQKLTCPPDVRGVN